MRMWYVLLLGIIFSSSAYAQSPSLVPNLTPPHLDGGLKNLRPAPEVRKDPPVAKPTVASLWTDEERKSVFEGCMKRKVGGPWVPPSDYTRFCNCYQKKMELESPTGIPVMTPEKLEELEQRLATSCIKK